MAHLVTGYAGMEHIQSADDGAFNAALFGGGQFVMESGNKFAGSIIDNNTVRILDGDLLMYGRYVRISPETYEDLIIDSGTAGRNRIDLICMTYEKDTSNGTEKAFLQVVKGAETEGEATVPACTDGNILEGATFNQMPLYQVKISGVVLESITPLFEIVTAYKTHAEAVNADLATKIIKNYISPTNLGLSSGNTVEEVMNALPTNSILQMGVAKVESAFYKSLPITGAGIVEFHKGNNAERGYVEWIRTDGSTYKAGFSDKKLQGWDRNATEKDLAKCLIWRGNITDLGLEDVSTAPIGVYSSGSSSIEGYGIRAYSFIYKPNADSFNGAFYICRQSGATQDGMFVYRTSQSKFERVPTSDDISAITKNLSTATNNAASVANNTDSTKLEIGSYNYLSGIVKRETLSGLVNKDYLAQLKTNVELLVEVVNDVHASVIYSGNVRNGYEANGEVSVVTCNGENISTVLGYMLNTIEGLCTAVDALSK